MFLLHNINFYILYNTYITRFVSGSAINDTEQVWHNLTDNNERTHGKTRMRWQCLAPRPFSLLAWCIIERITHDSKCHSFVRQEHP